MTDEGLRLWGSNNDFDKHWWKNKEASSDILWFQRKERVAPWETYGQLAGEISLVVWSYAYVDVTIL